MRRSINKSDKFKYLLDQAEQLLNEINKCYESDPDGAAIIDKFIGEWISKDEAIEKYESN